MIGWAKNNFPNFLTCCNLSCGLYGISSLVFEGSEAYSKIGILIVLAGIFDFFDGFAARILNVFSPIGKDLDSLADMVTFGALPSLVVFHYGHQLLISENLNPDFALIAFLIGILSAVRLAIFNNDSRQSDHFIGVPTPANCFFLIFLVIGLSENNFGSGISATFFLAITFISSILLVSPIPLIALKFKDFSFSNNWQRFTLIAIAILCILVLKQEGIPILILLYIGISILTNFLKKNEV